MLKSGHPRTLSSCWLLVFLFSAALFLETTSFDLTFGDLFSGRKSRVCPSTICNIEMVEPDTESTPLLLVSRLELFGLDETSPSTKAKLVLASQSPRRREILDMMMLKGKYTVETSPLDESQVQVDLANAGITSSEYTRSLAEAKALALAEHHVAKGKETGKIPTFYLGSDTVVELEGNILEKPKDKEEAKQMLSSMSGKKHCVHTGVALYRLLDNEVALISSFTDTAMVTFCQLSEESINAYVATEEPMDKAGSYGIQGVGGQLVKCMEGDFFTVMGLPMHKTSNVLARAVENEV